MSEPTAPQQDISVDDVARFLLAKDYELTALELFQETTEAGVAPVAVLREHFAAPATPPSATPSSSSSQLLQPQLLHRSSASHSAFGGSRDFCDTSSVASAGAAASFAGDAAAAKALRERDERCSLLEYELRIAKEDLDAARAQLSALKDASQKQQQQKPQNGSTGGASVASSSAASAMTAQEGRALHFIVKRHLMAQRLNMTAITLAEELGAQDADEWAEVGIGGLAEAPDLLQIYRHFVHQAVYVPAGFRERVEALQRECAVLQRVAKEGEHTIVTLSAEKAALEKKLAEARTTIEKLQNSRARSPSLTAAEAPSAKTSPPPSAAETPAKEDPPSQQPPATPETTSAAATTAVPPEKPERPKKAWQDEFKQSRRDRNAVRLREKPLLESRLSLLVRRLHELEESDSGIVHVLAESLPYIVRGVILSKREELVPLFLCAVQRSDDRETRLSLTTLFFNLIKRPDEQQRSLITEGFTALAAMVGPTRTTEELLEQCIKEVGSKYEERRVLVADSCTSLAQYSNPSVRTTTILSTLLNLLQDKSSNVRASAVTNLAALVTYFTDEAKLQSLLSETARLLRDPTEIVVAATMRYLVHALIDWSDAVSRLHTGFVSFFLENIISFLRQLRKAEGTMEDADRTVQDEQTRHAQMLLNCVDAALPSLVEALLLSVPSTAAPPSARIGGVLGPEDRGVLRAALETLLASFPATLPTDVSAVRSGSAVVDWMVSSFLQNTVQIALLAPSPSCVTIERVSFVVATFLREANSPSLNTRVAQAVLLSRLGMCREEKERAKLLVHYIIGVLALLSAEEIFSFVKNVAMDIVLGRDGWAPSCSSALATSLAVVCSSKGGARQEPVLAALHELAVHQTPGVRGFAAMLLAGVSESLSSAELAIKVLPTLDALKADPDSGVRCEDASALVVLFASSVADKATIDKATAAIDFLCGDKVGKVRIAVLRALGEVAQQLKPSAIETFVAPKFAQLSHTLSELGTDQDKADVAAAVWQSFRHYQGTSLSGVTVTTEIIPALRNILASTASLDHGVRQAVEGKLRQLESAVGALGSRQQHAPPQSATPPTSPSKTTAGNKFLQVFKIGKKP